METVVAERAAERRMSSPVPLRSTGAGTSTAGGSRRRRARWGADGRRIHGHETAGCGGSAFSTACNRSSGRCHGSGKETTGRARSRTKKFTHLDGKRAAAGTRQHEKETDRGKSSSIGSAAATMLAPFAKFEAGSGGKEAWPENSTKAHDRRSRFLEEHCGASSEDGDPLPARRRENTGKEHHDRRASCVSGPSPNPGREKTPELRRENGWREEVGAAAKIVAGELHSTGQQLENHLVPLSGGRTAPVSATAAYHTRTRVDRRSFPPAPPPASVRTGGGIKANAASTIAWTARQGARNT